MNTVLAFLTNNWGRLGLQGFGAPSHLSFVVATPRFRASKHVVFLILNGGASYPILVAKVPRLAGDHTSLDREATNLRAVHAVRPTGFDSIPRLVAYEDHGGVRLLVESAL